MSETKQKVSAAPAEESATIYQKWPELYRAVKQEINKSAGDMSNKSIAYAVNEALVDTIGVALADRETIFNIKD